MKKPMIAPQEKLRSDPWATDEMYMVNGFFCVYHISLDDPSVDIIHLPGGVEMTPIDLISAGYVVKRPTLRRL